MAKQQKRPAAKKQEMLVNVILDRSGSMGSTRDQTISGYNEYLQGLRGDADADYFISLLQFDAPGSAVGPELTISYLDKPLTEVLDLTMEDYQPRGMTPLYDAIGECVRRVEANGRPVVSVVVTDGMENASKEFDLDAVKKLIASKEKEGWKWVFLGANIDSFGLGASLGVAASATSNYAQGNERALYANLAASTKGFAGRVATMGLNAAQKQEFFTAQQQGEMAGQNYLTPNEAAQRLKVNRRTVYNQIRSGELPAKRIGRQWRISREDL